MCWNHVATRVVTRKKPENKAKTRMARSVFRFFNKNVGWFRSVVSSVGGKTRPTEKTDSVFRFRFFLGILKSAKKVGFRLGKTDKKQPKKTTFGYRF